MHGCIQRQNLLVEQLQVYNLVGQNDLELERRVMRLLPCVVMIIRPHIFFQLLPDEYNC